MKETELFEHICEYCSEVNDFGYLIVPRHNLEDFVKSLPLEDERPLKCVIMSGGYISIHMDELQKALCLCDETKEEIIDKLRIQ